MLTSSQNTHLQVGNFIISHDRIPPETVVSNVAELFYTTPDLDAAAVVENDKPFGLITRTKLLLTLSRRFGNELYGRHPIIMITDPSPLIVSENESLEAVISKAFARDPQNIYDEIIVTDNDGKYLGLLSVKQLAIEQSNALSRSLLLEEVASARAQELERINQVKTKFLANVTHELRSPVNAIIGLAELLRMAADMGSMQQVQERLSLMISTASNLRAIITNILDLSKINAGKMDVNFQEVDVIELLTETAETTRVLVDNKPITVRLTTPDTPTKIRTDPLKLRQILTNLTSNAAKFTKQGTIEISFAAMENSAEISVSDTGIGIKEEDLQHIFTPFGQVEDVTTKSHEGTGLGLTISKNLATLIGGSISVTSSYGKGATFTLSLPIKKGELDE
jgi:signal transduction histidine kinase